MSEGYKSRVYTDRPAYADFDAPAKFTAIQSIIAKRLTQYPKAICSYSGGADSDILIDLIEQTRKIFNLAPVKYVFFKLSKLWEMNKTGGSFLYREYWIGISNLPILPLPDTYGCIFSYWKCVIIVDIK